MVSIQEDDLVNELIRYYRQERDVDYIEPEAPFNHYGARGAVDLFTHEDNGHGGKAKLLEVKSQAAIEVSTGANEILRQFNRMRKYFFASDDRSLPVGRQGTVTYELSFIANPVAWKHFQNNEPMYTEAVTSQLSGIGNHEIKKDCRITFRHPDAIEEVVPMVIQNVGRLGHEPNEIRKRNPTIADSVGLN